MWKIFSLVPSKKPLTRETDTIKSWAILQNFNFGMLKLTKTPLPYCQLPNGFFVNLMRSFLLHQFLWWEVFLRERERIFYTYSGPRVSPGTGDRNIHHKNWQLCTHYHDIMAYGLAPEKNGLLDSETATYTAVLMQQEHVFLTKGDKSYLQYM